MITKDQLASLARQYRINEATILREYIQLFFLRTLYDQPNNKQIVFKGGTAIHFIYKAPRFSEDLDFTVTMSSKRFAHALKTTLTAIVREDGIAWKERTTITGKRYLLTIQPSIVRYPVFINLDFSFRERVFEPKTSIIETEYPVLFTNLVHHMSKNEMLAEKIRALITRSKGRDIYDLWYLLSQGASINDEIVKEKLTYYNLQHTLSSKNIHKKIQSFSQNDFVNDLKPFITESERDKLPRLFKYITTFLLEKL